MTLYPGSCRGLYSVHPIQIIGAPPPEGPHRGPKGAYKGLNNCSQVPIKKEPRKKDIKKDINEKIKK
jgi:hypothetical protein